MSVLVDTPIWSLSFRRIRLASPTIERLAELIASNQAVLIGPVRQEVLSGLSSAEQFVQLRDRLRSFPDPSLTELHWERAAEFRNLCRSRGVQGSSTDFLICAVADIERFSIFTTDQDFQHFARHLPIRLHSA